MAIEGPTTESRPCPLRFTIDDAPRCGFSAPGPGHPAIYGRIHGGPGRLHQARRRWRHYGQQPPGQRAQRRRAARHCRWRGGGQWRCRHQGDRLDRRRAEFHRRRRYFRVSQSAERQTGDHIRSARGARRLRQAGGRGGARQRARRRAGGRAGVPLSLRRGERDVRPARGQARSAAWRRRHPTPAAADRCGTGATVDRQR